MKTKLTDSYGNDLLDENGCVQYEHKYIQQEQVKIAFDEIKNKLSEAIRLIAEHDIELLSYKGQTLFNQLSNKGDKNE